MYTKREFIFIHLSIIFSLVHALGYFLLGLNEGFNICFILMIVLDLLYIPAALIKSINLFPAYLVFFSGCLVFITAFISSELFNNYSGLLCLFIAILIKPKYKNIFMAFYLLVAGVAFCVTKSTSYYLIIHYSRALWLFLIHNFIIYELYNRKPVILFDEEIELLKQLTNGEQIKSLELNGMSERTIRRRLDAAKKRNGVKTTEELKELYLNTYKQ